MKAHVPCICLALACLAGVAMAAEAEGAEPQALAQLREKYERRVLEATQPLTRSYLTALAELRKKLAVGGDLQAALLVQAEGELVQAYASSQLRIVKATWGSEANKADATDGLRKLVRNGRIRIKQLDGNSLVGRDPHFGVHKMLAVTYMHAGRKHRVFYRSNDVVSLP